MNDPPEVVLAVWERFCGPHPRAPRQADPKAGFAQAFGRGGPRAGKRARGSAGRREVVRGPGPGRVRRTIPTRRRSLRAHPLGSGPHRWGRPPRCGLPVLGAHVPPDLPPGGHGGGQRDPMLLPAPEGQARRQPPGHRGIGEVPPPVGDARGPNPTQRRVNARGTSGMVWGGWAWGQPSPSIPSPAHGPWLDGKARAKAPRATRR